MYIIPSREKGFEQLWFFSEIEIKHVIIITLFLDNHIEARGAVAGYLKRTLFFRGLTENWERFPIGSW